MTRGPAPAERFVERSQLLGRAFEFARSAHCGPASEGDTGIDHPVRVARLLHEEGFEDEVVAAALLHDVVEDTAVEAPEIKREFGSEVAGLVAAMTEDDQLEPYEARKAEHRERVTRDRRAAAIYAADKLANVRWMRAQGEPPEPQKLAHYRATLETLCEAHPDLPFLGHLRYELGHPGGDSKLRPPP